MKKLALFLIIISFSMGLISCGDDQIPIQFQPVSLETTKVTDEGLFIKINVRVDNYSDRELNLSEIKYKVVVSNKLLAEDQVVNLTVKKRSKEVKSLETFIKYDRIKQFFDLLFALDQTDMVFHFTASGNYGGNRFQNESSTHKETYTKKRFFEFLKGKN